MHIRPRRSVLYMPGSNARALEKAKSLPADALIFDLEDAVAPEAKEAARDLVCRAIRSRGYGHREVVVRVNALNSQWGEADLRAVAAAGPDAVLIPKASTGADINQASATLTDAAAPDTTRLWAMIETPRAILNLSDIAAASLQPAGRLACLVLGTNDLVKETRADLSIDPSPAFYWLSSTVTAARAFGLDALDGVYNDYKDAEGLRRECLRGRGYGFDGKTLIHPDQIAMANTLFAPQEAEVALARRIIAAFERPENKGRGVITLDGRMLELLHAAMARLTLLIAEAIARESKR
jgi:citrate lyase subunit beta / citryl-CoA lyase